jgi:capsular exopolysaccharide synthesis family protein
MLGDNEHDRYGDNALTPEGMRPLRGAVLRGGPAPYPAYEWYDEDSQRATGLDLQKYLRIILRHWLIIASALIVAVAVGLGVTLLTTPIYTATTTIQIDKETAKVPNMQTFETPMNSGPNDEFFQTQYGILKSRSLAEATAKDTRLDLARNTQLLRSIGLLSNDRNAKAPTTAQLQEALTNYIQSNLSVSPVPKSRLVDLNFDSRAPAAAAVLANAVAQNFIDTTLNRRLDSTSYARRVLQEQLASEKAKLEASERQLAAYARSQQIISISPSSAGGEGGAPASSAGANQSLAASSLTAMLASLNTAREERIKAEQRLRVARANASLNAPEVLQSPTIQQLKASKAKLEAEYQEKLSLFTPSFEGMAELRQRIADVDRQIQEETRTIQNSLTGNLENQYRVAQAQEQQLQAQVNRLQTDVINLRDRSITYDILQREIDTSRQLYDGLLQSSKEIGVGANLGTNNISIIDRALVPGSPSKPNWVRNLLTSAALGLLLGVGLAFLMELLDESIRSPEDVERKLGLPLLGTIPKLDKGITPVLALADARSNFSEAYYSVRTALQFSTSEGVPSSLVITSARPSEGKSTSSTAIAQNFARLGLRVLLIDSDLRNPSLHKVLNAENSDGFSNYLTGGMSLIQLAQETSIPGLSFIPCGPMPPNPAELLGSAKLAAMLREARPQFDMVVIDAPPVMGLADAPLLASAAAGTVLVVEAGGTGRNLAKTAIRRLGVGNAHLLGVLLTKFDARKTSYGYGYGYAYDYEYGHRPAIKAGA